jgi:hypothetical protein
VPRQVKGQSRGPDKAEFKNQRPETRIADRTSTTRSAFCECGQARARKVDNEAEAGSGAEHDESPRDQGEGQQDVVRRDHAQALARKQLRGPGQFGRRAARLV